VKGVGASGFGVSPHAKGSVFVVSVAPRSGKNGIEVDPDGRLRVRVTAAPVAGAANAAVLRQLAEAIGVPRSSLQIDAGEAGRRKRILALGIDPVELVRRIRIGVDPPR
jgi:uncharacterized protein